MSFPLASWTFRGACLKPLVFAYSTPKHYHCLHNVVGPSELSRSLTSRHTLPVFVNEWYDILQTEMKNRQSNKVKN